MSILAILIASVLIHEAGHALAAKVYGCKLMGLSFRWYGVGLKVDLRGRDCLGPLALGGLVATVLLALIFLVAGSKFGFVFNAVLLFSNLLPIKGLDGYYLLRNFHRPSLAQKIAPYSHLR